MISKIKDKRKAEKAAFVFVHCGGDTYQLVKTRYGDYFDGDFVRKLQDENPNVYVEGGNSV